MIVTITTTMRIIKVNLEDVDHTEDKIQVNFSEVKICMVEVNTIKIHTKDNIIKTAIKVIITKVIKVYIIAHAEISNRIIIMANLEAEAMVMAEVITMAVVMVGPIIKVMLTTNTISIMVMMMSTRQTNMVHHVHYVVVITTPLNIVLRENMISIILWKRLILVDINLNQVVYIPKGEHDDPHELPQQQELEGSTEIGQTLYSHTDTISLETNPFQKLGYIYQHFQDNEKIHESDPTTPCTHAYDHITQHINNLEDPTQQPTLYTPEVEALIFTINTTTLCDYNITHDVLNSHTIPDARSFCSHLGGVCFCCFLFGISFAVVPEVSITLVMH